jgi:pimeloyl-ACP methyl ester carboxylesterase
VTQARSPELWERRKRIAAALLAPDPTTNDDPAGRELRSFADATGSDCRALAAVQLATNRFGTPADVSVICNPTLVICGDGDVSPHILASTIPHAQATVVSGDHGGAIGAADFAAAILTFLA